MADWKDQNAVILFGVSERAYGRDVEKFFSNLNRNKNKLIESVGSFDLPKIKIEN